MQFRVTMKTPDALEEALTEAVVQSGISGDSGEDIYCKQVDAIQDTTALCRKWFEHGECLTVEIDTEAQTCTVVPVE